MSDPYDRELERFLDSQGEEPNEKLDAFLGSLGEVVQEFEHWYTDTANRDVVPEGERPCPICSQTMQTRLEGGIQVDVCPAHGIWLDGNELAGILSSYNDSFIQKWRLRNEYRRGYRDGQSNRWSSE